MDRGQSIYPHSDIHMLDLPNNEPLVPGIPLPDEDRAALRHAGPDHDHTRRFVIEAARLMASLHCHDVLIMDICGLSDITDYVLIGSGTSQRQIRSVGQDIESLAKQSDMPRFGREADDDTSWVVLDFVDCVVHLFEPAARAHYDLEMMWGEAPRVDWQP